MRRSIHKAFEPALRNMQYVEGRLRPFAIVAIIGFPLYYYIWLEVFPQRYENLTLRLIGSILFLPILFHHRWPAAVRGFLPYYWYAIILYALPFFFTLMLLKNDGSQVWVESTLIAAFVAVLLLDWLMLLLSFVAGVSLAVVVYCLTTTPVNLGMPYFAHLAILAFAILIGAVANYDTARIRLEQERAMVATAGSVAHELRTPLLAIRAGAAGLSRFLPLLLASYDLAQRSGFHVPKIRVAHLSSMRGVLERIEQEAMLSNSVIDMLLVNARFTSGINQRPERCSIARCVETTLHRYPFRGVELDQIHCDLDDDFDFLGSETLIVHVLFNLIKNSLRSLSGIDDGKISIRLHPAERANHLVFRDNGSGIEKSALPHIFTRFYTSSAINDDVSLGAGIGLAFCRDVMREIGGAIECTSTKNVYTQFVLTFPLPK
ncbi:HAMP domain-containing histidine kinase [Burkholderia seminalis]|uniref:sensor histidine kinase n=1 Tax=Burkholderia seminalis TaxID=488731 RepID=UPI001CF5B467|nr:HAMP domain-containing sensor histidine kinase [Burkholderia seminalis]MCA8306839.1 HAMP domain-containing histidine kinase [Burkholderia seminalis]MCA8435421.1 HAMP domain-containing histidine kinase [Burkholderia seminalis]